MSSPAQPAVSVTATTLDRDRGLLRVMGVPGLALGIIGIVVGAGIFALPAAMAGAVGAYAPLAFLGCALAVGCVALCFAEAGSRVPTSGGSYGYVAQAFGPAVGYVAGTLLWLGDVLASGGVAAALATVGAAQAPGSAAPLVRAVLIIGVIGAIALVNLRGVAQGTRLIATATVAKLLPLLVFVVVGALIAHTATGASPALPGHASGSTLGRALILGVFSFMGMETSLAASGEVRLPNRTIPRALLLALALITVLYVAIQLVAQRLLGAALAQAAAPLADAMGRVNPALRALMLAGTAISMLGFLASDLLGSPRVLFALARDGLLPRALGRLHPRTHVPHVAILLYATLAALLALSGTFVELAVLASLATAGLYILGCAAAWQLRQRSVALAGPPLALRALGPVALAGIVSMLVLIALASWTERLGLLIVVVLAMIGYRLARRSQAGATQ
ncbi:MAG TPA: APC family permease [Steroidobacteraceae bacterium]|nr:APC family permease [Steroidobacteraceae bacterium]